MSTSKSDSSKYRMTLSLNVLNHLGINLYSNIPSVISEAVANAWDADSTKVNITVDRATDTITISDNGNGMSMEEINEKFLTVGYRKRENNERISTVLKRPVMGRKGIGKLSLFSIAKEIRVYSTKGENREGLLLSLDEIKKKIESDSGVYIPQPLVDFPSNLKKGTVIVLKNLKKGIHQAERALIKRLARRFSVIGESYNFSVSINGNDIRVKDRDYFHKIQFVWDYNGEGSNLQDLCKNLDEKPVARPNTIPGSSFRVSGWIGTAKESNHLKDDGENLNRIVILMRGKLAQEDLLNELGERGLYSTYLIGEIEADFLDNDEEEDIATSSRQRLIEDDPRYTALLDFLRTELKAIQRKWSDLRDTEGTKKALELPPVKEWFKHLKPDAKKKAKSLFGKINKIAADSEEQRTTLLKHGILAFESLRYKENLDALDKLEGESLEAFTEVFKNLDDIEASFYHQIVTERIKVIDALREKVESDDLEKVVQQHLFKHLWLLDPSWERATGSEYLEQQVSTEFDRVTAKLSDEEKAGRIDIKYKTPYGKHVIIELKRAGRSVTTNELTEQIDKYRRALKKILRSQNRQNEPIEVICVLGKEPKDWKEPDGQEESIETLKVKNARVVLYQSLIENAYKSYDTYLRAREQTGPITELIKQLDLF